MAANSCGRMVKCGGSLFRSTATCLLTRPSQTAQSRVQCFGRSHQRRYSSSSSSKPSNAGNGTPSDAQKLAQQQQQQQDTSREDVSEGRKPDNQASSKTSRKRAKETVANATAKGKDAAFLNLPSVPSTHHLHPADIATSAFFSLHRPISVTNSVPASDNSKSFENIFSTTSTSAKPSKVISTLSSAIESLEAAQSSDAQEVNEGEGPNPDFMSEFNNSRSQSQAPQVVYELDAPQQETQLRYPGHLLPSQFRPFRPPPPPSIRNTDSTSQNESNVSQTNELPSATLKRSYSTVLTIHERTHANGHKTYTAHASPIQDSSGHHAERRQVEPRRSPESFRGRMRLRQERWQRARQARLGAWSEEQPSREDMEDLAEDENTPVRPVGMWTISVKRQRRLKMKKHKYKKHMRKTRNLRRRMEKT